MNPIAQAISDFFTNLINGILNNLGGAFDPLVALVGNTPLALTTGNAVVQTSWLTMTAVADAFLGLYVIVKVIQMMYGDATGTVHVPVGQFLSKVVLTVLLIHGSAFLGTQLIVIVNALCDLVRANVQNLILQVNKGQQFNNNQALGLSTVLAIIYGIAMLRVIFQSIRRVIFFNVLYVLSGPAFLASLDAQTAPWFQFWIRTYLVTILEQFLQYLTFGLGFQFLIATKTTGFTGFILAIAMLNLTAEIPSIMARFASSSGASVGGIGGLVRGAVLAAALFI